MKNLQPLQIALALALACQLGASRAADSKEPWEGEVKQADAAFWQAAFNECDLKKVPELITDDFEFFHDVIGIVRGKGSFVTLTRKNVCSIPNVKLRREAVDGTVSIEPLRNIHTGNKVYGAVVSGEHRFYGSEKGAPEVLEGQSRFVHVMLLKNGAWKVARAISYSHGSAEPAKK